MRGTIACPGVDFVRYGGNTSCLEVRCGTSLLILDAGTGLRALGNALEAQKHVDGPVDTDILLSHTHLDHISGIPFFPPNFVAGSKIRMWAGHLGDDTLLEVIRRTTQAPLFPVPMSALAADLSFHDFKAGEPLDLRTGVGVATAPLNHPNGATAYRITYRGKSISYVTDTEHVEGRLDQTIIDLVEGTDIFIYDATYTDEEYPHFKGWGHSTWQEGARLAEAAKVKTYVIFHHAPEHDDNFMDEIADAARQVRGGTLVAREGLILRP